MIETRELEALSGLGAALWADAPTYRQRVIETLAAVSLQEFAESQVIDRTATALLGAATQVGMAANTLTNSLAIGQPFFRLFPEERFLLVALHRAKWSYARTARLLGETPERIEEMAWTARVHLAATARRTGAAVLLPYPVGSDGHKASCPEWDAKRPWAQRFLDDEIRNGTQRFFLQNHLMACDGCRSTLMRCKDLYYALEDLMPPLDLERSPGSRFIQSLRQVCLRRPAETEELSLEGITFKQSLKIFAGRPDVRWMLIGMTAVLAFEFFRGFFHH